MKKLILLELTLIFLATTFQSDNPPGWYQQSLPVNNFINDIFFLDSLNGWVVTQGNYNANDTSYIMRTLNGGNNWLIQEKNRENLNAVQFLDYNTGYAVGGTNGTTLMSIYKTINGGTNWIAINNLIGVQLLDLFFVNNDTGWVCDDNPLNGGLYKTTNGGGSWVRQLDQTYKPKRLFFINEEIGWTISVDVNGRIYKTNNGGNNWFLQTTFQSQLGDIFFINKDTGWVTSGRILKTTDGGSNWNQSQSDVTGIKLDFVSDSIGWAGVNFNIISKTLNGGINWYYQNSPIFNNSTVNAADSLNAWAGGSGLVQTTDGGGLSEINSHTYLMPSNFILYQNYPNPFNPNTVINYELRITSFVKLKIFDMQGKEIAELVNQRQSSGEYEVNFNGNGLTSGVYFYRIEILDEKSNKAFTDTKKMVLVR